MPWRFNVFTGTLDLVDTGSAGATGPQGPPGFDGMPGEQGEPGPPGNPGPQGVTGTPGQQGSPGPPGIDGVDGLDGDVGPPGLTGATGATGAAGIAGPVGMDGLDGDDGMMGPPGLQGIPGINGAMGFPGLDGTDGEDSFIPGPIGLRGLQGFQGAPGMDGLDADEPAFMMYGKPFDHHADLTNQLVDDHTQYTLRAGRTTTTNDTTLTTSAASTGTLYGASTTASSLKLRPQSADTTTGTLIFDGIQSLFPSQGNLAVSQDLITYNPTYSWTATTQTFRWFVAIPTITSSATIETLYALDISPTITVDAASGGLALTFAAVRCGAQLTHTSSGAADNIRVFSGEMASFSATAAKSPAGMQVYYTNCVIQATGADTSADATAAVIALNDRNQVKTVNAGAKLTIPNVTSVQHNPLITTDTAGQALTITALRGLFVKDASYTTTGTVTVTSHIGVDVNDLTTTGITNTTTAAIRSAITSGTGKFFLQDTGGAQSSLVGKFTTYNNFATAGFGLPTIVQEPGVSATKTANFTVFSYSPTAVAGRFRVSGAITSTTATNTGTVQFTLDYKDSQGTAHTGDVIPVLTSGTTAFAATGTAASKEHKMATVEFTIDNSNTAIALKVVTTGTISYTVSGTLEQIA